MVNLSCLVIIDNLSIKTTTINLHKIRLNSSNCYILTNGTITTSKNRINVHICNSTIIRTDYVTCVQ